MAHSSWFIAGGLVEGERRSAVAEAMADEEGER